MVQSRIKAMSKMASIDEVIKDPTIQFNFPNPDVVSVQSAIQLIDVGFGYNESKTLFTGVNLSINTDSRICLVGANGVGKSTLLKIIFQELRPLRGVVNINNKIRMERFSQHHVDQLNLKKSALEQFKFDFPTDPVQKIRSHLGSMGISGKLALQPIYTVRMPLRDLFFFLLFCVVLIFFLFANSSRVGKRAELPWRESHTQLLISSCWMSQPTILTWTLCKR